MVYKTLEEPYYGRLINSHSLSKENKHSESITYRVTVSQRTSEGEEIETKVTYEPKEKSQYSSVDWDVEE